MRQREGGGVDAAGFVAQLGSAVGQSMGGSSGVLLEIFFRAMARGLAPPTPSSQTQVGGGCLMKKLGSAVGQSMVGSCGVVRAMVRGLAPPTSTLQPGTGTV